MSETKATKDVPYPERPYKYTHGVRFASGFIDKLVFWGAKCLECESHETFLRGGRPACKDHMTPLCEHGRAACGSCGDFPSGPAEIGPITKTVLSAFGEELEMTP